MSKTPVKKTAEIYRKVMPDSICPYGVKAKKLLEDHGYQITDHHLTDKAAVEAIKAKYDVKTTPQVFIDGERIGGSDDLAAYLGVKDTAQNNTTYQPVIALFAIAACLAVIVTWLSTDSLAIGRIVELFIAISMVLLGLQKLQDVQAFAKSFRNYDLLAKRWAAYGYIYPFVETGAGLLMIAGLLVWLSAPAALIVAGIGGISVFKAVYIDKRNLQCACVGGDSRVPLGFISLTENLMMVGMALWMLAKYFG